MAVFNNSQSLALEAAKQFDELTKGMNSIERQQLLDKSAPFIKKAYGQQAGDLILSAANEGISAPNRGISGTLSDWYKIGSYAVDNMQQPFIDLFSPSSQMSADNRANMQETLNSLSEAQRLDNYRANRDMAKAKEQGDIEQLKQWFINLKNNPVMEVAQTGSSLIPSAAILGASALAAPATGGGSLAWGVPIAMTVGGAQSVGAARGDLYQATMEQNDADLQAHNEEYRTLRNQGLSENAAKRIVGTNITEHLPELALSAATGAIAERFGLAKALRGTGGSALRNFGQEIISEGLEEGAQTALSNSMKQAVNANQTLGEDVLLSAAQGATMGTLSGSVAAAASKSRQSELPMNVDQILEQAREKAATQAQNSVSNLNLLDENNLNTLALPAPDQVALGQTLEKHLSKLFLRKPNETREQYNQRIKETEKIAQELKQTFLNDARNGRLEEVAKSNDSNDYTRLVRGVLNDPFQVKKESEQEKKDNELTLTEKKYKWLNKVRDGLRDPLKTIKEIEQERAPKLPTALPTPDDVALGKTLDKHLNRLFLRKPNETREQYNQRIKETEGIAKKFEQQFLNDARNGRLEEVIKSQKPDDYVQFARAILNDPFRLEQEDTLINSNQQTNNIKNMGNDLNRVLSSKQDSLNMSNINVPTTWEIRELGAIQANTSDPLKNYGQPILSQDGNKLIGGNRKIAALQQQYAPSNKRYLIKNADTYGFNPKEVAAFDRPVLVQRLNGEIQGNIQQTPQVSSLNERKILTGKLDDLDIANQTYPVTWEIKEARDIGATMNKSSNQYRDRTRAASEQQIRNIANNPDFRYLNSSPIMDYGAPTFAQDGETIIGGNGRTAGIQRAYEQGTANHYREKLITNAQQYGFNPDEVAAFEQPVLVRRLNQPVNIQQAAIASNEGGGLVMSDLEQAKVDAERLPNLQSFVFSESGDLNTAANRKAISDFVGSFPVNQRAALQDSNGLLSKTGLSRLKNALLYRAYGDSPTLARLIESTHEESRNVGNALTQAAPTVAEAKTDMHYGSVYDLDIAEDLTKAAELFEQIKAEGVNVNDWLAQENLIQEIAPNQVARTLVKFFNDHTRSAKAIKELINNYYSTVRELGSPQQEALFENVVLPTREQILGKVINGDEFSTIDTRTTSEDIGRSTDSGKSEDDGKSETSPIEANPEFTEQSSNGESNGNSIEQGGETTESSTLKEEEIANIQREDMRMHAMEMSEDDFVDEYIDRIEDVDKSESQFILKTLGLDYNASIDEIEKALSDFHMNMQEEAIQMEMENDLMGLDDDVLNDREEQGQSVKDKIQEYNDLLHSGSLKPYANRIHIVSRDDLKRPEQYEDLETIEGFYNPENDSITLIAESLNSPEQMEFVAWHELGHHKVNVQNFDQWKKIFDYSFKNNQVIRDLTRAIERDRKDTGDLAQETRLLATEEALMELYAAYETGNYSYLKDKYKVKIPFNMQRNMKGFFARQADKLSQVMHKVLGDRVDDMNVYDIMKQLANTKPIDQNVKQNQPIRYSRDTARQEVADFAKTGVITEERGLLRTLADGDFTPLKSAADWLIEGFADNLHPVSQWIDQLPISERRKEQFKQSMYRAGGMRDFENEKTTQEYIIPLNKTLAKLSKKYNRPILEVKRLTGYWLSANYAPIANDKLLQQAKDELVQAQKSGNKTAISAALKNWQERADAISGKSEGKTAGGYSNPFAQQVKKDLENHISAEDMREVAKHIWGMLQNKLDLDLKAGRISPEQYKTFKANPEYVPLTGDPINELQDERDFIGNSGDINQSKDKQMKGRSSMAEDGIDAAFKAVSKSHAYYGWSEFKNQLSSIYNDAITEQLNSGKTQQEAEQAVLKNLGIVREPLTLARPSDSVIIHKQEGKYYQYTLNNKLTQALQRHNTERMNAFMRPVATATRFYARLVTQFTPQFAPINSFRDMWEKSETIRTAKAWNEQGQPVNMDRVANLAIRKYLTGTIPATFRAAWWNDYSSPKGQELKRFLELGGVSTQGQVLAKTEKDLIEQISNETDLSKSIISKVVKGFEHYNETFDLMPSFAVYQALREQGVSQEEAAGLVLDTSNFRKTGKYMGGIKAIYMFAQPTATGAYNLARYLSQPKGRKRALAYIASGIMLYSILRTMVGEDEGGNILDQQGDITRFIPFPAGNGNFIKIPVGFGLPQFTWNIATNAVKTALGDHSLMDMFGEISAHWAKTVAPISPSELPVAQYPAAKAVLTFTPSILQPVVQNVLNRNAFGSLIARPNIDNGKYLRAEQGKTTTAPEWKDAALFLQRETGIDVAPEQIKNLVNGYVTGPFRDVLNILIENPNAKDLGKTTKTPFFNSLYGAGNEYAIQNQYYSAMDEAGQLMKEYESRKRHGDLNNWLTPEVQKKLRWYDQAKKMEQRASRYKRRATKIHNQGLMKDELYRQIVVNTANQRAEYQKPLVASWRNINGLKK